MCAKVFIIFSVGSEKSGFSKKKYAKTWFFFFWKGEKSKMCANCKDAFIMCEKKIGEIFYNMLNWCNFITMFAKLVWFSFFLCAKIFNHYSYDLLLSLFVPISKQNAKKNI